MPREVLAACYGSRVARRSETFLNYHAYGEPDGPIDVDYYFWIVRDGAAVTVIDSGFAPEAGRRRGRDGRYTPAGVLPALGIDPAAVQAVVLTHAHWDHAGNLGQFPAAQLFMAQAEYDFWTSAAARRAQFALHAEEPEIAVLAGARASGRLTLLPAGGGQLAPGIEAVVVGGHTPGELVVTVADEAGTVIVASDALHFYEEAQRDRPYAIVADVAAMYRGYDLLAELASEPGARLVAGHDPQVRARFAAHPAHPALVDLGRPAA